MKLVRKFGVEIEVAAEPRRFTPTSVSYSGGSDDYCCSMCDGYDYDEGQDVSFDLPTGWTFDNDGSCGSEFVSPVLSDTDEIKVMLDLIDSSGLEYDFDDCGLHIHVDARDFPSWKPDNVINVARFCRHFERVIYSFMDEDRKSNTYCRNLSMSNEELTKDYNSYFNRYHGCNIAAWKKQQTIEFRYAEGTTNLERISALAEFYTLIVERSKDYGRLKTPRSRIPKTHYLLDYLGVSDSTRQHLLKRAGISMKG